ncbi:hypothetical protein RNAN_0398 [Rheinheimera nanhaiensis E407-8]|uniref:Uncharacterized protein n=1 Tax=Rheinheimera nanhaiensis E407-8 TaxID=562729 RepID=I1DTQ2_9GAMM|nr:hypothetical protein RNAN_0398 [Rheinheimera nanhaiensis E407-8]
MRDVNSSGCFYYTELCAALCSNTLKQVLLQHFFHNTIILR